MEPRKPKKNRNLRRTLPMEFNPALNKFEPQLPLKKGKSELKINWKWLISGAIILLILIILMFIIT